MKITAKQADITQLDVDAIVNAANSSLAPGGGVCGAIHRAAGPELATACAAIGGCPTGEARITAGFKLKARFVIHAVGPVWHGGDQGEPELLASAYRASLSLAAANNLRSIAFPAISTGIYGYPLEAATATAVNTVRESLKRFHSIDLVIFACFSGETLATYERALHGQGPLVGSSPKMAGLCAQCQFARRIASARDSVFYLCERSLTDPSFPKYPALPVLTCRGFVADPRADKP